MGKCSKCLRQCKGAGGIIFAGMIFFVFVYAILLPHGKYDYG